ncbi:MAG: hypothetical protein AB7P37_03385 [Ramlibacter sp.]
MEELKLLVEMVANLPNGALLVLAGYLLYKLATLASIYGVIRLAIERLHSYATRPRDFKIGAATINAAVGAALQVQISRLASTSYIHDCDVARLKEALDEIDAKKREAARARPSQPS